MLRAMILGASVSALALAGCQSAQTSTAQNGAPSAALQATAAKPSIASESKFADGADGVKIHYVASGQGPLVVMIHGYPDFSGSWNSLVPVLNDSYRTVAMDTRGYNLSGQPKGVENYKTEKLVADIEAVIRAEGRDKAIIVGHDWGALQAWSFTFAHPDMVDKLIIMSVPHPTAFAKELATNPIQQRNSAYARNFQLPGSENSLTAEGLAGWVRDPVEKAKYIEAFKRSDFAAMMNYYRANYPDGTNAPTEAPPPAPPINVPVLVIHGVKDQALLASGHSGTWDYITKDSTILMIPDAGHFVQHDAADLVNATIRNWLDMRKG